MHHDNGKAERYATGEPPASELPSRLSRRRFLRTAGLGAAGVALPTTFASAGRRADAIADVVVVGTGAAGLSAAITAHDLGARVLVVEKAPFVGGTTIKSGRVFWVPNNSKLREAGLVDDREMALKLMARLSYPALYDPTDAQLGLPANEFALIAAFYDNGADAIDALETAGALRPLLYPFGPCSIETSPASSFPTTSRRCRRTPRRAGARCSPRTTRATPGASGCSWSPSSPPPSASARSPYCSTRASRPWSDDPARPSSASR